MKIDNEVISSLENQILKEIGELEIYDTLNAYLALVNGKRLTTPDFKNYLDYNRTRSTNCYSYSQLTSNYKYIQLASGYDYIELTSDGEIQKYDHAELCFFKFEERFNSYSPWVSMDHIERYVRLDKCLNSIRKLIKNFSNLNDFNTNGPNYHNY